MMANLFYNTPYWGYNGVLWRGNLLFAMHYVFNPESYPFNLAVISDRATRADRDFYREYGSREPARAYYDRARQVTKDRELAAYCCYMMDISRKQPQTSLHPIREIDEQDRTSYDMLRNQYRVTKFASRILRDCGAYLYFRGHSR